jgi:AraC family transcriptional regulator of adaptative response/methylated-DNA-[protein]-cysteine methyltransferase
MFDWKVEESEIDEQAETHLDSIERELDQYFKGTLRGFATPLAPKGTAFQQSVWEELCKIPYGETISYTELSNRLGNPLAIRAVAAANGANQLAIVIPCHRVIAANGDLHGYSGGLDRKRFLIDHERGQAALF